ncbi:MAG: hypothetical protein V4792_12725 [Pseudomonadota bacterium]
MAFVVAKPGALSGRRGVGRVDAPPKNAYGKVLKTDLRSRLPQVARG